MLSSVVLMFLMFGIILAIDGYYHDEIAFLKNNPRIEYRNVPSGINDLEFVSSRTSPADFSTLDAILPNIVQSKSQRDFENKMRERYPIELNVVGSTSTSETDHLPISMKPSSH